MIISSIIWDSNNNRIDMMCGPRQSLTPFSLQKIGLMRAYHATMINPTHRHTTIPTTKEMISHKSFQNTIKNT